MKYLTEEEIFDKLYEKGCFLLGQLSLDVDEINYIINYTRNIIDLDESFISEKSDLILSLGLVIIAISDYQDGNYWGFLQLKLRIENLSPLKQGIIGRKFLNTLKEYGLFQLSKNESGMNRYVENIKAHAFITDNYMKGYYDFLYDYYEKNLFRDISTDVEETLQDLSDYMKTTLNQNGDIIYSNNINDMKTKSYRLLKSTREVIAQCDGKTLLELFYTSLSIIDRNFYDGIIPNENDGRFAKAFIEWNNEKQIDKEYKRDRKFNFKNNNSKPYIVMENSNEFYLIIPKRRFRANSNGNVSVNININGLITIQRELEVSINMGTYISEELKIPIEYPFGKIIIKYSVGDINEIVLHNNTYIIFDENQHQINEFRIGRNYVIVEKGNDFWIKNESYIESIYDEGDWILYVLNIDNGFMCTINNIPLSTKGKIFFEPIYKNEIEEFKIYDAFNNKLIATKSHPFIIIKIKNVDLNGATIKINNKNISIKNENIEIFPLVEEESMSVIIIDFNKLLLLQEGFYNIELNLINGKNKELAKYLLLEQFEVSFDKEMYINDKIAILSIKSRDKRFVVKDNEYIKYNGDARNSSIYIITLNESYQEVTGILNMQKTKYIIKIPINMLLYGNSIERLKYYNRIEKIWYRHLNEIIYIKVKKNEKIGLYEESMLENIAWGEKIEDGLYRLNISNTIRYINNKEKNDYLFFLGYKKSNDEGCVELFSTFKKPNVNLYFELKVENDKLYFEPDLPEIKGMKIFYSVKKIGYGRNYIIENRELIKGRNYLPELKKAIYYEVNPFIEESDEFEINKNRIQLDNIEVIVFSDDDEKNNYLLDSFVKKIEGKMLKINNIRYEDIELKIDFGYNYKIENIRYMNGHYIGILCLEEFYYNNTNNQNGPTQNFICNVKISNLAYKNKEISFYMESFSFKNQETHYFYYDNKKKCLLSKAQYTEKMNEYRKIIKLTNKTRFISWVNIEGEIL